MNPLRQIRNTLASTSRDCGKDKMIAYIYGIVCGWDNPSYKELKSIHGWTNDDIAQLKSMHRQYQNAMNSLKELRGMKKKQICQHDYKPCDHEAVSEFDECTKCGHIK
jgi:hypothetical protein